MESDHTYDVQHSLIVNKIHLHQTIEEPKDIPSAQIVSSYVRHTESGERRTSITIEWPEDCPAWIYHAVGKLCRVTVEPVDVNSPESAWATFLVAYTPSEPTP